MSVSADPPWRKLLELARFAPSPHNTQPWKLRLIGEARADLYLDRERALPHEDVTGSFVVAGMSMFVETLRLVAANAGWRLDVSAVEADAALAAAARPLAVPPLGLPGPRAGQGESAGRERLVRYARLALVLDPDAAPAEFTDSLILDRQTSRLPPSAEPASRELMAALTAEASAAGQRLTLIDDSLALDTLMEANLDAVVDDLNRRTYHDEIAGWLRYGRAHEQRTRDGLSARCLRIPPYELAVLARFPWLARWRATRGVSRALYARRVGAVPRLMVLSGPFWRAGQAVEAGRCLMRLWLIFTRHRWYLHPFGNLITHPEARLTVQTVSNTTDPWIVFRAGSTPPPPRSERLHPDELIIE